MLACVNAANRRLCLNLLAGNSVCSSVLTVLHVCNPQSQCICLGMLKCEWIFCQGFCLQPTLGRRAQTRARLAAAEAKLQQLQGSSANPSPGPQNIVPMSPQQQPSTSRRLQGNKSVKSPGCDSLTSSASRAASQRVPIPHSSQTRSKISLHDDPSHLMNQSHPTRAQQPHLNRHVKWDAGWISHRRPPSSSTSQEWGIADGSATMVQEETAVQPPMLASDLEQEGLCIICMELPVETAFQPCMHAVSCVRCAQQIMRKQNECPICRAPLQSMTLPGHDI